MAKKKTYRVENDLFHEETIEAATGYSSHLLWDKGFGHSAYIPGPTKEQIIANSKDALKSLKVKHREIEEQLQSLIDNPDPHIVLDENASRRWK